MSTGKFASPLCKLDAQFRKRHIMIDRYSLLTYKPHARKVSAIGKIGSCKLAAETRPPVIAGPSRTVADLV
jgi:hypothetical protein